MCSRLARVPQTVVDMVRSVSQVTAFHQTRWRSQRDSGWRRHQTQMAETVERATAPPICSVDESRVSPMCYRGFRHFERSHVERFSDKHTAFPFVSTEIPLEDASESTQRPSVPAFWGLVSLLLLLLFSLLFVLYVQLLMLLLLLLIVFLLVRCFCCCLCCFCCFFWCLLLFGALCCLCNLLMLVRLLFVCADVPVVCAAAFCCFRGCFLGRPTVEPHPCRFLTFQNVNNNSTIDETPSTSENVKNNFLYPEKIILRLLYPKNFTLVFCVSGTWPKCRTRPKCLRGFRRGKSSHTRSIHWSGCCCC